MKSDQTSSDPVRLPVIAGASTSELGRGIFAPMPNDNKPLKGTIDHYREMAKTNPDIAALLDVIDRLKAQLVKALEAVVENIKKEGK